MKTNIVHMSKIMKRGDKFTVVTERGKYSFVVMAVELYPQGAKNAYWVAPVLKGAA